MAAGWLKKYKKKLIDFSEPKYVLNFRIFDFVKQVYFV